MYRNVTGKLLVLSVNMKKSWIGGANSELPHQFDARTGTIPYFLKKGTADGGLREERRSRGIGVSTRGYYNIPRVPRGETQVVQYMAVLSEGHTAPECTPSSRFPEGSYPSISLS